MLSLSQEWFRLLADRHPQAAARNPACAFRVTGTIDLDRLQRALAALTWRYPALRPGFGAGPDEPRPVALLPGLPGPFELPVTSIAGIAPDGIAPDDRVRRAGQLAAQQVRQPFPSASAPGLRAHLFRLADDDHVLLLWAHHMRADQESLDVLCDGLAALYPDPAMSSGEPPSGEADVTTGTDGQDPEGAFRYWHRRLAGFQRLVFPADQPRPAQPAFGSFRVSHTVPAEATEALDRLGRAHGATLFMVVAAAFTALLARRCGQDDVTIGAAVASREQPESARAVGCLTSAFPLRVLAVGDQSFTELLTQVRVAAAEAQAHQALAFGELAAVLEPEPELSHGPITDVMLTFVDARRRSLRLPGAAVREFTFDPEVARFDVELTVTRRADILTIDADCRTDLFRPDSMERMLGHLVCLLGAASERPSLRVPEFPLLGEEETARLLEQGRGPEPARPISRTLHELFSDQVAARPQATAVRAGDQTLSYRELSERADRVAAALRDVGAGPGTCVGVCLERSIGSVVSILGVIKAGGCYLPLDPSYPADRLAFMLADSRAAALVTTRAGRERLPDVPAVLVDESGEIPDSGSGSGRTTGTPTVTASPQDLAYIMYTSGSTGTPKGVAVPHRGVINLVREAGFVRLGPGDRIAHASNLSFDGATFEIWGALINGSELVIITQDELLRPDRLALRLREDGVSVLSITPPVFSHIAREVPDAFRTVAVMIVGGASLDPSVTRKVLLSGPPGRLLHAYGPTEITMLATTRTLTSPPEEGSPIPIGRPITGTYVYVLDKYRRLAPAGVPGELYVGGLGLAAGYAGQPELTAASFVPDPYGPPGSRLYRTGDMARWLPAGELEFLGRQDDQVKLRGYRIELGEVRARLAACEGVDEAVVVLREDEEGARLVAYFVPVDPDRGPEASELKTALADWLPAYMLPSAFIPLSVMPLTANGKIDHSRLPPARPAEPGRQAAPQSDQAAPQSDLEGMVAEEWSRILRVPGIDGQDDFFDLGGDSLQAARVVNRLSARLGTEITIRDLFDHSTCEGLATVISSRLE